MQERLPSRPQSCPAAIAGGAPSCTASAQRLVRFIWCAHRQTASPTYQEEDWEERCGRVGRQRVGFVAQLSNRPPCTKAWPPHLAATVEARQAGAPRTAAATSCCARVCVLGVNQTGRKTEAAAAQQVLPPPSFSSFATSVAPAYRQGKPFRRSVCPISSSSSHRPPGFGQPACRRPIVVPRLDIILAEPVRRRCSSSVRAAAAREARRPQSAMPG